MSKKHTKLIFDEAKFTAEYERTRNYKLPSNITPEAINLAFKEGRYYEAGRMIFKYYVLMNM